MHRPALSPELLEEVRRTFAERSPFNRHLGLSVHLDDPQRPHIALEMAEHLVGNHLLGILHGGAIAAVLDVAGGLHALVGALLSPSAEPPTAERYARLVTVQMAVNYLRPGKGERFVTRSQILRQGRHLSTVFVELLDETSLPIATATATYTIAPL